MKFKTPEGKKGWFAKNIIKIQSPVLGKSDTCDIPLTYQPPMQEIPLCEWLIANTAPSNCVEAQLCLKQTKIVFIIRCDTEIQEFWKCLPLLLGRN